MDLDIMQITPTNSAYTMNNGIPTGGKSNIIIRVVNCDTFITFYSPISGVTGTKLLQGDSNPNAEYYSINVPANATGTPRLVEVYGRALRTEPSNGILILSVMQNG
jgi:hypothetical protein